MEIYSDYLKTIKSALRNKEELRRGAIDGLITFSAKDNYEDSFNFQEYLTESKKVSLLPSLESFANDIGIKPNYEQELGAHPDFIHLKDSDTFEKHYIVSMFIDIKGSTNLFKRYNPETVFVIANTIQKAAIHTCLIFGGYIHRLQGDGLFVYFGGKSISEKDAVSNSLKAASIFSYFVKHDIRELFNQEDIEDIYTRIGIDFGQESDVVWALAGIGKISEITTCSLHTSLASKMQSFAQSNGIVAGDFIKIRSDKSYYSSVNKRTGKESDRYIFRNNEEGFFYTQYDFDWLAYLKNLEFIQTDLQGNINVKRKVNPNKKIDNLMPIAQTSKPYNLI